MGRCDDGWVECDKVIGKEEKLSASLIRLHVFLPYRKFESGSNKKKGFGCSSSSVKQPCVKPRLNAVKHCNF